MHYAYYKKKIRFWNFEIHDITILATKTFEVTTPKTLKLKVLYIHNPLILYIPCIDFW